MPAVEMSTAIGRGLIVTEQTLIEVSEDRAIKFQPWAFSSIKIDGKDQPEVGSTTYKNVIKTFVAFSAPLLTYGANKSNHNKPLSQQELVNYLLNTEKRLSLMCISALATGRSNFEHLNPNVGHDRGVVLACGMAAELVVRAQRPNEVGPSVRYMSNMIRHASDRHLHESLAKARVTTTPSAALKADARGFIKACLEPSVTLKPRALNLHQADNLNLKVTQGSKAGTVMSLTLTAHRIPDAVKIQRETTLYADGTAPHLRTSRKRNDWATMIQQSTQAKVIEDIFAPTEADYNELHTLIHVHRKATMMFFQIDA